MTILKQFRDLLRTKKVKRSTFSQRWQNGMTTLDARITTFNWPSNWMDFHSILNWRYECIGDPRLDWSNDLLLGDVVDIMILLSQTWWQFVKVGDIIKILTASYWRILCWFSLSWSNKLISVPLLNMTHAAPSFPFFPLWQQTQHHRERRSGCHV